MEDRVQKRMEEVVVVEEEMEEEEMGAKMEVSSQGQDLPLPQLGRFVRRKYEIEWDLSPGFIYYAFVESRALNISC